MKNVVIILQIEQINLALGMKFAMSAKTVTKLPTCQAGLGERVVVLSC